MVAGLYSRNWGALRCRSLADMGFSVNDSDGALSSSRDEQCERSSATSECDLHRAPLGTRRMRHLHVGEDQERATSDGLRLGLPVSDSGPRGECPGGQAGAVEWIEELLQGDAMAARPTFPGLAPTA